MDGGELKKQTGATNIQKESVGTETTEPATAHGWDVYPVFLFFCSIRGKICMQYEQNKRPRRELDNKIITRALLLELLMHPQKQTKLLLCSFIPHSGFLNPSGKQPSIFRQNLIPPSRLTCLRSQLCWSL